MRPISAAILWFVVGFGQALGAGTVELSNEHLRLGFDTATGSLQDFYGREQKHQFLTSQSNGPLWELRYRETVGGAAGTLNSTQAVAFQIERLGPAAVRLKWEGFSLPLAPQLRVEAVVDLEQSSALSRWKIAVRQAAELRLDQVLFPRVPNLAPQTNEFLAVPLWMGRIVEQPRAWLNQDGQSREMRGDYPGLTSMQCLAFYRQNGPGFYISCDDTNALPKTFVFSGDGRDGAKFSLTQLPTGGDAQTRDYAQPYSVILGAFSGDWVTAAEMYRAWAVNQWWARESRAPRARNHWAQNTGLWVWNRGYSEDVIEPALLLQQKLHLPVSVMWHWWHQCAYDVGFPEYLPPREGAQSFTNALAKAHQQQVRAIVYMNQRLWGMTTRSWEAGAISNYAVLSVDGKVQPEVYNTFTKSPCASMCLGTPFWRQHYASLAEGVFGLGVDGIYMDQACSSLPCYNAEHGHPLGGGTYWMNGFRMLAADIRNRAATDVALAGEGVGESWLPYLDLMLSLEVSRERYLAPDGWETIPFFQAVYHPLATQYGNYSSLTLPPYDPLWPKQFAPEKPLNLLDQKFSGQFYLEQARAFVWGQQPAIANFRPAHFQERPEEMAYVLRLATLRSRALKFLRHGTFLRPPELDVPRLPVDFSRLSIYAGQQGLVTNFCKTLPAALTAAWRAPDGAVGIAVASIHDRPMSVRLDLTGLRDHLPEPALVNYVDEHGRKELGRFAKEKKELAIELPGYGACVVELAEK